MNLADIFAYLRGWCRFELTGNFPERLLNLAARKELGLWDISKTENACEAKIIASRYKRLLPLTRKCKVRLRVLERRGLPFLFKPFVKRPGMPLGALIFCGTLWFLSLFIWYIELPEKLTPKTELLVNEQLEESGLHVGALRSGISGKIIANEIIMSIPEVSWAGISIIGSNARLELKEIGGELKPEDRSAPCNLVASSGGVIVSIIATEGQAAVVVGDTVAKGDLLISGVVEYTDKSVWFVHSEGEVFARTGYELSASIPYEYESEMRSGRVITMRRLSVFGLELPLHWGKLPQGNFEREIQLLQPILAGTELPANMRIERWYELETALRLISREEAMLLAKAEVNRQLEALGDIEISESSESLDYGETEARYTLKLTAIQEISEEREILH